MSVAAAVIAALEEYEFDPEAGFARLGPAESPCLNCALSVHRDNRLTCVVDATETCCTWCQHNHKKCTAIPPELKAVVQHYWNQVDFEVTVERSLTPLQRWRVVECFKELGSALRSLVDVLANPCRTSSNNPIGVAPVLQVQELAATREYLTLLYRVQAGGEQHDDDEIEDNISRITPSYARECSEASVFTAALDRLPLAFRDPLPNENPRKKASWPKELPADFHAVMERCVAAGNPTPRIVVRFAGQGVSRRGPAQATPQRRRQNMEQTEGESSEQDDIGAPPPSSLRRSTRKRGGRGGGSGSGRGRGGG